MRCPNDIVDFILMSVVFFGWIAAMELRQKRERAEAEAELAELEARTLAGRPSALRVASKQSQTDRR